MMQEANQAAPITLRPMQRPIPTEAHAYGLDSSKKRPTLNASPESDGFALDINICHTFQSNDPLTGEEEV